MLCCFQIWIAIGLCGLFQDHFGQVLLILEQGDNPSPIGVQNLRGIGGEFTAQIGFIAGIGQGILLRVDDPCICRQIGIFRSKGLHPGNLNLYNGLAHLYKFF